MTIDERDLGPLARELPVSSIEPARHLELREAVLREVERVPVRGSGRSRATVVGITIAIAAAAASIVFMLARSAPAPGVATHRATVQSTAAADLEHTTRVARGIHDEVVRLRSGRVSISVERLARDERFRVVAGDGEVEVRGTAFDVLVVDDRLAEVTVHHGLVEVRVAGSAAVAVAGGEQWSRTAGVHLLAIAPRSAAPTDDSAAEQRGSGPASATAIPPDLTRSTTAAVTTPVASAVPPRSTTASGSSSALASKRVAPSRATSAVAPSTPVASASSPSPSSTSTPSRPSTSAASDPSPSVPGELAHASSPPDAPASTSDTAAVAARPTSRSPTERAFDAGRAALRAGDFGTAAEGFRAAIAADPDAALAEDARYWRGIALARAGRDADARVALAEFLARHPTSLHVGRASIVVGNLLVRAGELAAARPRFEAALVDPDPDVRSAARSALAALPPPRP